MQLLKVLDQRSEYLESGGQIDVIYTDLEKAFDNSGVATRGARGGPAPPTLSRIARRICTESMRKFRGGGVGGGQGLGLGLGRQVRWLSSVTVNEYLTKATIHET
jgi:hypothetical protein